MASWEDEDFEVDTHTNEFGEEQEELMGDWETAADSDEEANKPAQPKISSAEKIAQRKQKEQEERERKALEKTGEATRAEQRDKELQSDLNNASDLLAAADIHPRSRKTQAAEPVASGPTKLSDLAIFKVSSAKEYATLRKTVVPLLNELHEKNSALMHSNFVIETARDLCKPLTSDQIQKVIATLNAVASEKAREERAKRLNNRQKPQVKQASAKQESKPVATKGVEALDDDGLDDDDFM